MMLTDQEIDVMLAQTQTEGYPNDVRRLVHAVQAAEREMWAKKCDDLAAILRSSPDEKKQISAHMADWLAVELRA